MRAFKFRLQPVLDLKEQEKETLQQSYQRARENLKNREEDLQRLKEIKKSTLSRMDLEGESSINPRERKMDWTFIELLNGEIERVTEDVRRLEKITRERFLELVEKMREEKSLERLKETLFQDHRLEQERVNQKEIDEIGQQQFHLRQGEGL